MNRKSLIKWWRGLPLLCMVLTIFFAIVLFQGPITEVKAKDYPVKSITIIVPWPPGSLTDLTPRLLAPFLSKRWGVPVNVVNKPGGSGIVGNLEALRAPPDGYTMILECSGGSSVPLALAEGLPYKVEERTYVARVLCSPHLIGVRADSSWKSMEDIVKAIRENPASFKWASTGGLSSCDVVLYQLRNAFISKGLDLSQTKTVAFQGGGPTVTALGGGHIDITYVAHGVMQPMISAGKVRVVAVVDEDRYGGLPDIKTTVEQGFPSVNYRYWNGISGPPGLPKNIVQTWVEAVKAALNEPEILSKIENLGAKPVFLEGDDFKKFVLNEAAAIKAVKPKSKRH